MSTGGEMTFSAWGAEPQHAVVDGEGSVQQRGPLLGDVKAVGNALRRGRADGLVQGSQLLHADLIGDTRLFGLAQLGHQLQLGAGEHQVLHLEPGDGNAVEDGVQVLLDDIIEIVGLLVDAALDWSWSFKAPMEMFWV